MSAAATALAIFQDTNKSVEERYQAAMVMIEPQHSGDVPFRTLNEARRFLATNAPKSTVKVVEKTEVSYADLVRLDKPELNNILGTTGEDGSAEAWFVYFWTEMKLAATQYQTQLTPMVKELFTLDSNKKLKPKIPLSQYAEQNSQKYRDYLEFMLRKAFTPYPASKKDLSSATEANILQVVKSGKDIVDVPYTWRADDRAFEQIKESGGFHTKADSQGYANKMNINKPWHPYSKPDISRFFWFRLGQGDNCLYTVVSVGIYSEFQAVLPFPKLDGAFFPPRLFPGNQTGGKSKVWDSHELGSVDRNIDYFQKKKLFLAKCTDGSYLLLPGSETWVYLFLLGGVVLETNKLQKEGKFPEVGAKDVKLRNIYGAVRFVRFFHGPDDADGFTAVVDKKSVRLVGDDTAVVRTKRFGNSEVKLSKLFEECLAMPPTGLRWKASGSGFEQISATYEYLGKNISIAELADRPVHIKEFGFPY